MRSQLVTSDLFRRAWSNFATGVTVITTRDGEKIHGMTANGVTSVSLEPPLALVVIAHERNTHPLVMKTARFGISVLSSRQQDVARYYTKPAEERLEHNAPQTETLGRIPVIADALSSMDCRVVDSIEAGDHTIFVGEVEKIELNEGEPLLYYRSTFRGLAR